MSLATKYLGLDVKSPSVASASPLNSDLDNPHRPEDAGAAAVVLPSLFQEQIEVDAAVREVRVNAYADSSPEAASNFLASVAGPYGVRPDRYVDMVRRATDALSIPVIASLNGATQAGWIDYARPIEQAGATALELNRNHVPTDPTGSDHDVEARYFGIVKAVCATIALPVAEGETGGARDSLPFDYAALRDRFDGARMVNNGYDRAMTMQEVASGEADFVSFGRLFIANPDLVARLRDDAPLNALMPQATLYGGGAHGYTDYSTLDQSRAAESQARKPALA